MKKTIEEIYQMIARYEDATLIYSYTKKGSKEWQNIEIVSSLRDEIEITEETTKEESDKYDAFHAAYRALYDEYEVKANDYVKEIVESAGFKDFIAENGYAY